MRIVDVGCGSGNTTYNMFKDFHKKKVLAFDMLEEMVEYANEKYGSNDFSFEVGNITDDFEKLVNGTGLTGDADLVTSMSVLHWVEKDLHNVVKNISSMLRKGDLIMCR